MMYAIIIKNAIENDKTPASIDSCPKDGPTCVACTTFAPAGNLPAPKTSTNSLASS
ncbi:hypothetical protein D3C71_2010330 [compost metagenome]